MIRIFIADDHAIVRHKLRELIASTNDMKVVGEAADGRQLLNVAPELDCDLIILDLSLPRVNGPEVLRRLRQMRPNLPVLVLSMYPEDQYAFRALKAGASGYLTKMTAAEQLVDAIRTITRGRKYITQELAESLAESFDRDTEIEPHSLLSDREFQTLKLIASGKQLAQIGADLALSPKTVSVYRARLLAKLGLSTNAELTRYAIEHGLLE